MRGRKLITTRFIMVRSCHEKVFKKFQESLLLCNSVQSKIVKKHTFTRDREVIFIEINLRKTNLIGKRNTLIHRPINQCEGTFIAR